MHSNNPKYYTLITEMKSSKKHQHTTLEPISAATTILTSIGEDPTRNGLLDTPKRMIKALEELTWGQRIPEEEFLAKVNRTFEISHDQMISVCNIRFTSLCEHHILPFIGTATVAYIPDAAKCNKVLGISKLARIVEYYAARLQVQERMTTQIADALEKLVQPKGVGVWLDAVHTCMSIRGVRATGASTVTSDIRGAIQLDASTRNEFLTLARRRPFNSDW